MEGLRERAVGVPSPRRDQAPLTPPDQTLRVVSDGQLGAFPHSGVEEGPRLREGTGHWSQARTRWHRQLSSSSGLRAQWWLPLGAAPGLKTLALWFGHWSGGESTGGFRATLGLLLPFLGQ